MTNNSPNRVRDKHTHYISRNVLVHLQASNSSLRPFPNFIWHTLEFQKFQKISRGNLCTRDFPRFFLYYLRQTNLSSLSCLSSPRLSVSQPGIFLHACIPILLYYIFVLNLYVHELHLIDQLIYSSQLVKVCSIVDSMRTLKRTFFIFRPFSFV